MRDEHLVNRVLSGDSIAFEELVRRYYDSVRFLTFSILEDPNEAEDITQDAFLKVYNRLNELKEPSSFSGWLKKIASNLAINRLKQIERSKYILLEDIDPDELAALPFDGKLTQEELIEEVMRAIEELPEDDGGILKGKYLEEKGYEELARKYNLSYNAVIVRAHRARKKVREIVLNRLKMMMLIPWKRIFKPIGSVAQDSILVVLCQIRNLGYKSFKPIGGVAVKLSTKLTITGISLLMLGGIGVLMLYHKPDKSQINLKSESPSQFDTKRAEKSFTPKPGKKVLAKPLTPKLKEKSLATKILSEAGDEDIASIESSEGLVSLGRKLDQGIEEIDEAGEVADEGAKELSPELQRKVELYAELAKILPEYRRAFDELHQYLEAHGGGIKGESAPGTLAYEILNRHGELFKKIRNLCDPLMGPIGPPAITRDERGAEFFSFSGYLIGVARYMGKELPIDGKPDYFSAQDYQGRTGTQGWLDKYWNEEWSE